MMIIYHPSQLSPIQSDRPRCFPKPFFQSGLRLDLDKPGQHGKQSVGRRLQGRSL